MATLTIRDFPDGERDRLRRQAAENGRSMEAEARRLILEGLARPKLSVDETVARLQAIMAKMPKRKSKKLLSEEFLEERRAMWGDE
jgi:plasmid stability protein